jgi:hypothetical protein
MDWSAWGPTVVAIVTAVFIAGQVTGRIKDQEKTLESHDVRLGNHDDTITEHSVAIAEGKAWRLGYSAGRGKQDMRE